MGYLTPTQTFSGHTDWISFGPGVYLTIVNTGFSLFFLLSLLFTHFGILRNRIFYFGITRRNIKIINLFFTKADLWVFFCFLRPAFGRGAGAWTKPSPWSIFSCCTFHLACLQQGPKCLFLELWHWLGGIFRPLPWSIFPCLFLSLFRALFSTHFFGMPPYFDPTRGNMKKKITYKASVRLRPPGPTLFPGVMLFTLFGGTQDADLYRQQYFDRPPDLKEYFGVFYYGQS